MRGIIAAGGLGSRVRPALDKMQQLVFDKPLLYYLVTNLMKACIRDILIVCSERNVSAAETLFRDSSWELNVNLTFAIAPIPDGPAGVLRIPSVKRFIANDPVCMTLDGIYHGGNFDNIMVEGAHVTSGATIVAAKERDPRSFGWIKMDDDNKRVVDIIEKPCLEPDPNRLYPVQTGIYFYGPEVVDYAASLQLSSRGEYEVTDLNKRFLHQSKLDIKALDNQGAEPLMWGDPGTPDKILSLSIAIRDIQQRGLARLVGSPHLQALRNGWITAERIEEICASRKGTAYYDALTGAIGSNPVQESR